MTFSGFQEKITTIKVLAEENFQLFKVSLLETERCVSQLFLLSYGSCMHAVILNNPMFSESYHWL